MEQQLSSNDVNQYGTASSAVILTSLFAGVLEAAAAVLIYEMRPSRFFQFIASGLFGKEALVGGVSMALCGLLLHFLIAFTCTYLYFIAYPKFKILAKHKILNGFIYGMSIWAVMNFLIIPVSRIPQSPFNLVQSLVGMFILMIAVGLPITILTHRYYSGTED